jgi:hypothetical protein
MYFEAKLIEGSLVFALGKSPAVWVFVRPIASTADILDRLIKQSDFARSITIGSGPQLIHSG